MSTEAARGGGRWSLRTVLARALVGGSVVLAVAAGVLRVSGFVSMRLAAKQLEERFGAYAQGGIETSRVDATLFRALLEHGGATLWPDGDGQPEAALVAAAGAYARATGRGDASPRSALRSAAVEILHRPSPRAEAWALVDAWLPRWEPALRRLDGGETEGAPRADPVVPTSCADEIELNELAPGLAAIAVYEARRGNTARAEARLEQALGLARSSGGEPSVAYASRAVRRLAALAALQQILRLLPSGIDVSARRRELESFDPLAELRAAALAEWRETVALYRDEDFSSLSVRPALVGFCLPDLESEHLPDLEPVEPMGSVLFWHLLAGHDGARFTRRCEAVLEDLSAPARALEERAKELSGRTPWYAPTGDWVAPLVGGGLHACIEQESALRLARIGLLDREQGRDAALDLAARTRDPALDEPIQWREEADGSLTLWCVGSDREDLGGDPENGDVVWRLPPVR